MVNILELLFGKSDAKSGDKKEDRKDPVCGMQIKDDSLKTDYQDKTYYFCSAHCKGQFVANPTNFVD